MNPKLFPLFCCAGLALFISITSTWAQTPKTSKIVFTSTRDGNAEIYTMNVNGSKAKNLTQHDARDEAPVWSPTGEHIAFHSNRHGLRDLYIMDADGRNVRKLFKDLVYREFPTCSPDGKMLAYHRSVGGGGRIPVVNETYMSDSSLPYSSVRRFIQFLPTPKTATGEKILFKPNCSTSSQSGTHFTRMIQ